MRPDRGHRAGSARRMSRSDWQLNLSSYTLTIAIGLDSSRYQTITAGAGEVEREFHTLESQISDADRFKDAEPFSIHCRQCHTETTYRGLVSDSVG